MPFCFFCCGSWVARDWLLSPFDLVVTIMIAELAALPMENPDIGLLNALVPILTLTLAEITVSYRH